MIKKKNKHVQKTKMGKKRVKKRTHVEEEVSVSGGGAVRGA